MFRGDLTAERFKGDFFGGTSSPWSCSDPTDTSTGCVSNDSASFTAYSLMANAYVDLATVMHVTPYVGAGIGMTYVDWGPLSNTLYCVSGTLPCGGAYAGASTHGGLDSWRLTYALMAGASYKLTKNTELDFGYRWRHVDGGDFFSFTDTEISAGAVGAQAEDDGFDTHEIRVGLRYDLW
jgi:opacity protein-like surface antigen